MIDVIAVIVILLIVGCAVAYIVRAKKKGVRCIGCPAAGTCSGHHGQDAGCGCGSQQADSETQIKNQS